ncbi:hypothetical protein E0K93_15920 [Puniceibacterium sp. HSS470]|nr:hypothetical protein E0K93_15920 [Puniceibacterium sp. HSS470]|tara:strand:- start:30527 stop:31051 length:525 start_codon:yes stop_codon:yes gene_type:complete
MPLKWRFGEGQMPENSERIDHAERPDAPRRRWGALVFGLCLLGVMAFYAWSVIEVSRSLTDYLLIVPAAIVGALAALWAGITDLKPPRGLMAIARPRLRDEAKPLALLVLTVLYACAAPFAGFDIATALFIAGALFVQGERTWWKIALAALPGAALITWAFTDLLLVRLPVTFL